MEDKIFKINFLVELLNKYSNAYYNGEPIATDEEYDKLYHDLEILEKETGYKLTNSPIDKVGFQVQDKIEKTQHSSPMLSLKKIHSIDEIKEFMGDKTCVMSLKEDGLTVRLTYKNGKLIKAETRGDGNIGSDITYNVIAFQRVPLEVEYKEDFIVDGEIIVTKTDFDIVNSEFEEPFKLQRSLASGSVSLLDPMITKSRRLTFVAWNMVSGQKYKEHSMNLSFLNILGFLIVPYVIINKNNIQKNIDELKSLAEYWGHPIDGMVITYDNIAYGDSLGRTEHHFNNGVAYKFDDEIMETTLRNIEWSMGRTGDLTPVAIFDPVIIDGTEVTRASCHNLTYIKNMNLGLGDRIGVYKANMIIPQIKVNYTNIGGITRPLICPYCGELTLVKQDNDTEVVYCPNENCSGKLIGKFTHFVSKSAMNIDGMSESTLKTLIDMKLIHDYKDLYYLSEHKEILMSIKGYGPKKVNNLLDAIEKSRSCKLENFINSLGIPLIGKKASRLISEVCKGDVTEWRKLMLSSYDWTFHDGFGKEMTQSFYNWYIMNLEMIQTLVPELNFVIEDQNIMNNVNNLNGQTFCITGSLIEFHNREECEQFIINNGGKIVSGVSKKTNYLICNEPSTSSKYKKAQDLNIPIITENDLKNMIGE